MLARLSLVFSVVTTLSSGQNRPGGYHHDSTGDTGLPYIHDASGDFGPYKLWKLRQEQKLAAATQQVQETVPSAAPTAAPRRRIVAVKKQKIPEPILPAFQSFPSRKQQQPAARPQQQSFRRQQQPTRPQTTITRPAFTQPQPAAPQFQLQPQTPEFISQTTGLNPQSSFALRSYAYTAPTYAAQAQGTSFSYEALL